MKKTVPVHLRLPDNSNVYIQTLRTCLPKDQNTQQFGRMCRRQQTSTAKLLLDVNPAYSLRELYNVATGVDFMSNDILNKV